MLAAAMTLSAPNLLVRTMTVGDGGGPAQALVCLDTICYPPVSDPAALAAVAAGGGGADGGIVDSPFQNVLDLLG